MNYFSKDGIVKVKNLALAYKKTSIALAIVVLVIGYYGYSKLTTTAGKTEYVLSSVQKGTLITSVTGTGQILASDQIDIKPKVSGQEITWVGVNPGDKVYAGQALMSIDDTDAKTALTSAEQSLVTAQLQYQKDKATAPIDYQNTNNALTNAQDDLDTTFNDTFNTLSGTYLDLPVTVTGTQNILYGFDLSPSAKQWNIDVTDNMFNNVNNSDLVTLNGFAQTAESDLNAAMVKYNAAILLNQKITRSSSNDDITQFLAQTIDTTTSLAQALQSQLNWLGDVINLAQADNIKLPTTISTLQTSARSYLSTVNTDLSSLLAQKKSIDLGEQAIVSDQQNIQLLQVGNTDGTDPISLQIEANNITTQETNLAQLKQNVADCTIYAPFDGIISAVDVKKGDIASSAAVATIITNQALAEISLNEIDATKISVGEKATLTFDAIDGLTISGTVAEIDSVGTVSQGVVSYNVKIDFDTQDSRIRPGMTVNAAIQSEVHEDTLYVPSGAVKTKSGTNYVETFNPPLVNTGTSAGVTSPTLPIQTTVTTGISDGTNVEILTGLVEGQQVVSRTILSTTATKTTTAAPSATSLLGGGAGGARGGGAAGVRIGG